MVYRVVSRNYTSADSSSQSSKSTYTSTGSSFASYPSITQSSKCTSNGTNTPSVSCQTISVPSTSTNFYFNSRNSTYTNVTRYKKEYEASIN